MRHLREVRQHEAALNVLTHTHDHRVLVRVSLRGTQHVAQGNGLTVRIRNLNTNCGLTRNRGQNTNVRACHSVRNVLAQRGHTLHLRGGTQLNLVAGHGRAAREAGDLRIHLELLQHVRQSFNHVLVDFGGFLSGRARNQHLLRRQHVRAAGGLHNLLAARPLGGRHLSIVLQRAGCASLGRSRSRGSRVLRVSTQRVHAGRNRRLSRGCGRSLGRGSRGGRLRRVHHLVRLSLRCSFLRSAEAVVCLNVKEGLFARNTVHAAVRHGGALHLVQAGCGRIRRLNVEEVRAARISAVLRRSTLGGRTLRSRCLVEATGQTGQAVRLSRRARLLSGSLRRILCRVLRLYRHLRGLRVSLIHHGAHECFITGVLVQGRIGRHNGSNTQPTAQTSEQATRLLSRTCRLLILVQVAAVVLLSVQVHGLSRIRRAILRGGSSRAVRLLTQSQSDQVQGTRHHLTNRSVRQNHQTGNTQQQVDQNLNERNTAAHTHNGGAQQHASHATTSPDGVKTIREGRVTRMASKEQRGRHQHDEGAHRYAVITFNQVGPTENAPRHDEAEHRDQQGALTENTAQHGVPGVQGRTQQTEGGVGTPVVPLHSGADQAEQQNGERAAVTAVFGRKVGAHRADGAEEPTDSVSDAQPDGGDSARYRVRRIGTALGTASGGGALAGGLLSICFSRGRVTTLRGPWSHTF